jgi:hypothetical protein
MKFLIKIFTILGLYARNIFTRTQLEVNDIRVAREVIAGKTRTRIHWQTRGCHRISIGNNHYQPGTIKGVTITEKEQPQTLLIRFSGYHASQEYQFDVPITDIDFFNQFRGQVLVQDLLRYGKAGLINNKVRLNLPDLNFNINLNPVVFNVAILPLTSEQDH